MRAKFVNEKYTEISDPVKDMGIGLKDEEKWAHEMVSALENHKVTQFGGSIPVENAKIEFVREGSVDVTASIQANAGVRFNLYFGLRDERRWNDPEPKWSAEVSISSPARRGFYSKTATGKNTTPTKLLELLTNMLNLKYKR